MRFALAVFAVLVAATLCGCKAAGCASSQPHVFPEVERWWR